MPWRKPETVPNERPDPTAKERADTAARLASCEAMLRSREEELRQLREALESSQHFASFPLLNPNPVLETDLAGNITFANPATRSMLDSLGLHEADARVFAPPDLLAVLKTWDRQRPLTLDREVALRGRTFSETIFLSPQFQVARIYAQDITMRKQAEEELRESRENLDRAQTVGQIGWWRLDTRKNVLTWSDENHRIFGIPKGTLLSYESFLAAIHPDDRNYVDTGWKAGLKGEPYDIEHRLVVNNSIKWVREKAYLEFDESGSLLGGFGITQDITARKQAEEELFRAKEELELRVAERTEQLMQANRLLEGEIAERSEAERLLTATNNLLKLFSKTFRRKGYLDAVVELLKSLCGCKGVGIRLVDTHDNIPYSASSGFSRKFLEQENCIGLEGGSCICPRITLGKAKKSDSAFLTSGGSFVCNNTSLLKLHSKKNSLAGYRPACVRAGFGSLAVIPISYRGKRLGVIHIADKKPGNFTSETIDLIESLTPLVGEAHHRFSIEEALVVSRERMRSLTNHLQKVVEEERIKIAREIHDELGQALTAAGLELSHLRRKKTVSDSTREALKSIEKLLDAAVVDVQRICSELRPRVLDHLGLQAAIEWQAKNFSHRTGIKCSCSLAPGNAGLTNEISTVLFRILQEALTNIARHSNASEASIRLDMNDREIVMRVRDNGKGATKQQFEAATSFGIIGIRERAHGLGGTAIFESARNKGSTLTVTVPLRKRRLNA